MSIVCNSIDSYTKNIAKELGVSDGYACNLISTWQTVNASAGVDPTAKDLKELMLLSIFLYIQLMKLSISKAWLIQEEIEVLMRFTWLLGLRRKTLCSFSLIIYMVM